MITIIYIVVIYYRIHYYYKLKFKELNQRVNFILGLT